MFANSADVCNLRRDSRHFVPCRVILNEAGDEVEMVLSDMDEEPYRTVTPAVDIELMPGGVLCSVAFQAKRITCNIPKDDLAADGNPTLYQVDPWRAPMTPGKY